MAKLLSHLRDILNASQFFIFVYFHTVMKFLRVIICEEIVTIILRDKFSIITLIKILRSIFNFQLKIITRGFIFSIYFGALIFHIIISGV